MSDVNNVTLIGRLTRDAELRYTVNGKPVSKFSLAVNEKRKIGDQWENAASFFEMVLWGQIAESLNQYLIKGKQIAVTGRLTQERWEQNGQNRSKVVVTAETVQLLGSGNNSGNSGNGNGYDSGNDYGNGSYGNFRGPVSASPPQPSPPASPPPGDDGFTDDIPF
jgi:single-strand DNA-binding protein